MSESWQVIGYPAGIHAKPLVLRKFDNQDAAVSHALTVNMDLWDDVTVESREDPEPKPKIVSAPPFPWSVEWTGGYAYVVDASGRKIMSLLGCQRQRELIAEILCDLKSEASA